MALKRIYTCDRCRKETESYYTICRGKFVLLDDWYEADKKLRYDLCNDCYRKLKRFLNGKSAKGDKQ